METCTRPGLTSEHLPDLIYFESGPLDLPAG